MRKIISLNDDRWWVGAVPQKPFGPPDDLFQVSGWLPATVPGDVRLDLLRAGKIPDPFLGMNNLASQWIDDEDWWYRRDLELSAESGERTLVILEGVDYQSGVVWNEVELGRHV